MSVLYGLAITIFAFAVHVGVWRSSRRTPGAAYLIVLFVACVALGALAVAGCRSLDVCGVVGLAGADLALAALVALALCATYVLSYPALQACSPSVLIVLKVASFGEEGARMEDLQNAVDPRSLVSDRIDDLVEQGLAFADGDVIVLSSKGHIIANIFIFWRHLLRREIGG